MNLTAASLVGTNFEGADLTGCRVYGISVWSARLDGAKQSNLLITPDKEPAISVDSLEVAQLPLLRKRDYVPVLLDFEKPASKDLTGTISTLANMARFIIADLTDPSSVPHELRGIALDIVVPIQTVILEGHHEYAMFLDLKKRYDWVLEPYQYNSLDSLLGHLNERVIAPAEREGD